MVLSGVFYNNSIGFNQFFVYLASSTLLLTSSIWLICADMQEKDPDTFVQTHNGRSQFDRKCNIYLNQTIRYSYSICLVGDIITVSLINARSLWWSLYSCIVSRIVFSLDLVWYAMVIIDVEVFMYRSPSWGNGDFWTYWVVWSVFGFVLAF